MKEETYLLRVPGTEEKLTIDWSLLSLNKKCWRKLKCTIKKKLSSFITEQVDHKTQTQPFIFDLLY